MVKKVVTDKEILRRVCTPVEKIDADALRIATDLKDTLMASWNGEIVGGAYAAPQIGEFKRIVVLAEKYADESSIIFMFNPTVVEARGKQSAWELCMSTPTEFCKVERPYRVKVEYVDENGVKKLLKKTKFGATILCHEIDHLDGKICSDVAVEIFKTKSVAETIKIRSKFYDEHPEEVYDDGLSDK